MRRIPVAVVVALFVVACAGGIVPVGSGFEDHAVGSGVDPVRTIAPTQPAVDPVSGLPVVVVADLPSEAAETLALIEAGGPFPYEQDGATFQNREGLLPSREAGYYAEYTVATPGSDDRGARRIVTGAGGERYWTGDHYDSFSWIAP